MKQDHLLTVLAKLAGAVAVFIALAALTPAQAQTDNFNSGSLGPNWATSISDNYPGFISFSSDPYGGKAIRMVATNCTLTPDPVAESAYTPRVMAWRTDRLYTNFYVAVDVLGWDKSIQRDTNGPLIALFARATNVLRDPNIPVGQPDCMIFWLNYNRFGGVPQGTRGVIDLGHLKGGGEGSVVDTLGVQGDFTLDPGHSYRMVFTGTNLLDGSGGITNSVYWGRVYDLQDLTRPLAAVCCPDPWPGFDPESPDWEAPGYSGIASVGDGVTRSTDVTFDNFVAAEYPPASVSFPGTTNGEAGLPQVVNRTPSSWSNFYPAAGGISFTATTLGGGNVTGVKLFLNGVDVSSALALSAVSNSRTATFPGSGLTPNTVYDGRIELANASGQKTTNIWNFDTFSDAYLAASCKTIECEDFDFNGGQFIDDPLPSGFTTNVTYYNNYKSVPYPWPGATNQDLSGPPYTSYVNKGTTADLGVDYRDIDGHEANKMPYEAEFRPLFNPTHSPGTSQGSPAYTVVDYWNWFFPGNRGENMARIYDTQRQKYYDLDPQFHDIQEYLLDALEGGEWYNYTRIFNASNYYNVYLRGGSEYTMQLRLDQVMPGPTLTKLGEFYTTNSFGSCNYRYSPLLTVAPPAGSLIVNGDFAANASAFTVVPGYTGGSNPSSITGWTLSGAGGYGLNGSGTSAGYDFAPANPAGLTYAFLQGGDPGVGHALRQNLTTLAPNTTYTLTYAVAGRVGNNASYRVVVSDSTTSYYDSGVQPANGSAFVTINATFTTPATLGSAPNIHLGNWSDAGDNTVDYANVFLVLGSTPAAWSSRLALVNLSGTNTLRLTVDTPAEERTKYGLMLNYLAFVPALLVESSSQARTGYTIDSAASVEPVTRQITIPKTSAARFYRLRWPGNVVSINSISVEGSNVVMTYR